MAITTKYLQKQLKVHLSLVIIILFLPFLVFMVLTSVQEVLGQQETIRSLKIEMDSLSKKVAVVKSNNLLTQNNIDDYNSVLSQLIPESEDYFSIIYALEQLSMKTGFIITSYTVDLAATSPEKISILVEGNGDTNTFLHFLEQYQFEGGRLVTNEQIQFSSTDVGKIKINLSFYNKKTDPKAQSLLQVSPKDINLMEKIRSKVQFTFKQPAEGEVNSYPTKSNPF